MNAPRHRIGRLRLALRLPGDDNPAPARALAAQLAELCQGALGEALDQALAGRPPARLGRLELDIGQIERAALTEELPRRVARALAAALNSQLPLPTPAHARTSLNHDAVLHWLAGAPWSGPPTLDQAFGQALARRRDWLLAALLAQRAPGALSARLAQHLAEASLGQLVEALQPGQGGYIVHYASRLREQQRRAPLVARDGDGFRAEVWAVILLDLLVSHGSAFNRRRFVAATLRQLAARHNLAYHALLSRLTVSLREAQAPLGARDSLLTLLHELAEHAAPASLPAPADHAEATADTAWLDWLAGQAPAGFAPRPVLRRAARQQPARLRQALLAAPPLALSERLAAQLDEDGLAEVVQLLAPGHADYIVGYARQLRAPPSHAPLLPGTPSAVARAVWAVIVHDLLVRHGSEFNRRRFIAATLRQLAARHNVAYRELLARLSQHARDWLPAHGARNSLLHTLSALAELDGSPGEHAADVADDPWRAFLAAQPSPTLANWLATRAARDPADLARRLRAELAAPAVRRRLLRALPAASRRPLWRWLAAPPRWLRRVDGVLRAWRHGPLAAQTLDGEWHDALLASWLAAPDADDWLGPALTQLAASAGLSLAQCRLALELGAQSQPALAELASRLRPPLAPSLATPPAVWAALCASLASEAAPPVGWRDGLAACLSALPQLPAQAQARLVRWLGAADSLAWSALAARLGLPVAALWPWRAQQALQPMPLSVLAAELALAWQADADAVAAALDRHAPPATPAPPALPVRSARPAWRGAPSAALAWWREWEAAPSWRHASRAPLEHATARATLVHWLAEGDWPLASASPAQAWAQLWRAPDALASLRPALHTPRACARLARCLPEASQALALRRAVPAQADVLLSWLARMALLPSPASQQGQRRSQLWQALWRTVAQADASWSAARWLDEATRTLAQLRRQDADRLRVALARTLHAHTPADAALRQWLAGQPISAPPGPAPAPAPARRYRPLTAPTPLATLWAVLRGGGAPHGAARASLLAALNSLADAPAARRRHWRGQLRDGLAEPLALARLAASLPPAALARLLCLWLPPAQAARWLAVCQALGQALPAGWRRQGLVWVWAGLLAACTRAEGRARHPAALLTALLAQLRARTGLRELALLPAMHRALGADAARDWVDAAWRLALAAGEPAPARPPEAPAAVPAEADDSVCLGVVNNAGLVLLTPFLSMYFERLGWLRDGGFVDELARGRAVFALHRLAGLPTEAPEEQLALNKLLCGLPAAASPPWPGAADPAEHALADSLLYMVTQRWDKLKHTSVAGLQETFLRRDGRLLRQRERLWLEVSPRAYDMLLDSLPWGYSMIKLPWMSELLQVRWRHTP